MVLDQYDYVITAAPMGDVTGAEFVTNPTFETNTTGWESNAAFGLYTVATLARVTSQSHSGSASLRATWPTGGRSWVNTLISGLTPGRAYEVSAWVKVPAGDPDVRMEVAFTAAGALVEAKDQWVQATLTFVASGAAHFVGVGCLAPTSGDLCYIDDVSVREAVPLSLGFNTAISKDRPYQRATATFNKDQLDTAASVGDQSLTGWWTRGQLSFHKGAGVKYYEVLGDTDDTVTNRFDESADVDLWTSGEVSLGPGTTTVSLPAGAIDAVPFRRGSTNGALVLYSGGSAKFVSGGTPTGLAITATAVAGSDDGLQGAVIAGGAIAPFPVGGTYTIDATTAATAFTTIAYAKGRLLALDDAGGWYQLATATPSGSTAVTSSDLFWAVDPAGSEPWSVSDSPSVIYFANRNLVYAATVDTSGLVPALEAGAVAASLPVGETIYSIRFYLGYLVICTDKGVRVALGASDGSLTLGPLVIRGDFSCRRIGTNGDIACVTGTPEGGSACVVGINLTQLINTLIPGWAAGWSVATAAAGSHGALLGADGALLSFDATSLKREATTLAASGTLTTGLHRLGTLESKAFRSLRVKAGGEDGTIDVSVSTSAGYTYSVGSVAAGDTEEFDLSTVDGFPSAIEYLSITFTLNRGGVAGPTLLGYQLKALPVPRRQRMIQIPLMLMDAEVNRNGQRSIADPWERLAALESLEQSNSVVTFEDKLTGETGSAYIESVEVSRTAPKAFGGFITLTLRVI